MFKNAFDKKSVLVTGHTGFKGSWLTAWLKQLGAKVVGIALEPPSKPSNFISAEISDGIIDHRVDIRNQKEIESLIISAKPDFIFHLAAQALVQQSYEKPLETWHINLFGTLNVLEALREINKECAVIIITSDKCYDNVEWVWGYRENDSLGGSDPYSASKGATEIAIRSHIKTYFPIDSSKVRIASVRAGNVIGGGDWASNRIVPDCVKAWSVGDLVELRNPNSTRPWQHVLEPLSGYLSLAVALTERPTLHGQPFNFGPQAQENRSVLELVKEMAIHWPKVRWEGVANKSVGPYECGLLKLNCDKALHELGWHAVMKFEETVQMTTEWYRNFYEKQTHMKTVNNEQIVNYTELAKKRGITWAY